MRRSARGPSWTSESSVAEVATLQIELKDLSHLTGDKRFKEVAEKVRIKILNSQNWS